MKRIFASFAIATIAIFGCTADSPEDCLLVGFAACMLGRLFFTR